MGKGTHFIGQYLGLKDQSLFFTRQRSDTLFGTVSLGGLAFPLARATCHRGAGEGEDWQAGLLCAGTHRQGRQALQDTQVPHNGRGFR